MSGKKKSGNKDKALQAIVFVTAIIELINALIEMISRLIE